MVLEQLRGVSSSVRLRACGRQGMQQEALVAPGPGAKHSVESHIRAMYQYGEVYSYVIEEDEVSDIN